jgi:hypothetical protein
VSRAKGPRHLRPEEAALWELIAARTQPLHPKRKASAPSETAQPLPKVPEPKEPIPPFAIGERAGPPPGTHDLARPLSAALASAPVAMDR